MCLHSWTILHLSWMKSSSPHVLCEIIPMKISSNWREYCTLISYFSSKFFIPLLWWWWMQLNSNLSFVCQNTQVNLSKASFSNNGFEVISYCHNLAVAILMIVQFDVGFLNHLYSKGNYCNYKMEIKKKNFKLSCMGIYAQLKSELNIGNIDICVCKIPA